MNSLNLLSVKTANVLFPLLFSIFTVVAVLVFIWLMIKVIGKSDENLPQTANPDASAKVRLNFTALLSMFLVIGLILRLIFVFIVKGHRGDIGVIENLFEELKSGGFGDGYDSALAAGIMPITYYIYAFMGLFVNALGLTSSSVLLPLFIKLPLIIADLVTALVLYKLAKKYLNAHVAALVSAFVCVFPVFIFASSVWATTYSLLMMFIAISLYFVVQKNYIALIGSYGAALLCHKDALYLFPLIAVFVIYNMVKACIALKNKPVSFGEMLKDSSVRPVFTIPVSIVSFLIVSYLLSLPVLIDAFGAGFFTFIFRIYLKPLVSFSSIGFGRNSLGIFNLFMRNGKTLNSRFPSVIFTILFAVIITGIVLLVYLSKKNRANLIYLAAYILLTLATYFVGFGEFSLLAVLTILLMAFMLVRDKRILAIFGVFSLLIIVNASSVMANALYYNNNVDHYFTADGGYAGSAILSGGKAAITIVCSALAVLTHLYSTIVLLDISMSNKRNVLPYDENAGFGKAMKQFFALKNK